MTFPTQTAYTLPRVAPSRAGEMFTRGGRRRPGGRGNSVRRQTSPAVQRQRSANRALAEDRKVATADKQAMVSRLLHRILHSVHAAREVDDLGERFEQMADDADSQELMHPNLGIGGSRKIFVSPGSVIVSPVRYRSSHMCRQRQNSTPLTSADRRWIAIRRSWRFAARRA